MRDLAFVGAWVVLLPLALQGAQYGVLLWTWTSLLAPNEVLYGLGAGLPFAKIAAALTLGLVLARRGGGMRMRWDASVICMIGLALVGVLSQSTALAISQEGGWDLFEKYVKILLLAITARGVMRDRLRLHALLLVICLGIGFTGLGEGAKFLLSAGGHKVEGTPSTGDNNQVGLDVLLIVPILYYLQITAKRRVVRITCIAVSLMCMLCVLATNSRAAFIGLGVLGIAYILGSRRKLPGLVVVALLALAGSQVVSQSWIDRMNSIKTAEDDDSFMGRVGAWKVSTAIALDRPLFGGGFHAVQNPEVWESHWATAAQFSIFDTPPPPIHLRAAHSIYFEILGDLGFVGEALFLGLFGTALRNAVTVRRMVRRSGRGDLAWAASLAGTLQVSVTVFLVGGASLSAAYFDIEYLLVAMLAVLRDLVEDSLRAPVPTEPKARGSAPGPRWGLRPQTPVLIERVWGRVSSGVQGQRLWPCLPVGAHRTHALLVIRQRAIR